VLEVSNLTKTAIFSGIAFLGFGLYFLLQQYHVQWMDGLYTWPTLAVILGAAFLVQAYKQKDYEFILPGTIIAGIGLHFHVMHKLELFQDHAGVFLLLVAVGLLLTYVKTGSGFVPGLLFLIAATLLLFFDRLTHWLAGQGHDVTFISNFWPLFFVGAGLYFLFVHRKK
jgi:hypothetical protein